MNGIIFDIKEFALNDGDGIRTTVFFKGCPLRCIWCHNPEGLLPHKELFVKTNGCKNCGLCRRKCNHPECQEFKRCVHICPNDLISIAGTEWESDKLAEKLLKQSDALNLLGGGITLSGGEPLLQHEFCMELLTSLKNKVHASIETSGYANNDVFSKAIKLCDFVFMDLKLFDNALHKQYTGVCNTDILKNAEALKKSGIPHTFRIPLIPGITDTNKNLEALASVIGDSHVELLPYNKLAPAKYKSVNREFSSIINAQKQININTAFFKNVSVRK